MAETSLIGYGSNIFYQSQRLRSALRTILDDLHGPRPVGVEKDASSGPSGILNHLSGSAQILDECEKLAGELRNLVNNSEAPALQAGTSRY